MITQQWIGRSFGLAFGVGFFSLGVAGAADWVWASARANGDDVVYFRGMAEIPALAGKKVRLELSCDNAAEVWVNGKPAGKAGEWQVPVRKDIQDLLVAGRNVIAVKGRNEGGIAGLVVRVRETGKEGKVFLESGKDWRVSMSPASGWEQPGFDDKGWKPAVPLGKLGVGPWGDVFSGTQSAGAALDPAALQLLPGFKAELLYTVPRNEQGSWVSLTMDDKDRFIAGDQDGGLFRITVKEGAEPTVEPLNVKTENAQGLLYTHGALYLVRNGGESGLYRLRDTNGDDQFDEEVLLRRINGGGEHGPHGLVLSPDGNSLYIVAGNHTRIPDPETSAVPRLWGEDHLIPRMPDANGHAAGVMAPGGWIAKTDFDGKSWELMTVGFRNTYDIAFSAQGELFGYDSDMEWDIGMPWYRPTRVCHAVPGGEFGWRNGSGKWPVYYPDSLPPVVDIGPGSPTGVLFGYGARFPEKYRQALYVLDWTYGTMYAIHLSPRGASWTGQKEEFVSGKPLPLTDAVIRPSDGAMYFLIGGRKTQSALYRVTWAGETPAVPVPAAPVSEAVAVRRSLEALQLSPPSAPVVDKAWPALGHPDRFIRFAARTVIENQPVASWAQRALDETRPDASITALIALARAGDAGQLPGIVQALGRLEWGALEEAQRLALLRGYALAFVRMGPPSGEMKAAVRAKFDPVFPAASFSLNKELCELLVAAESRQVVPKALTLIQSVPDDTQLDVANRELLSRSEGYAKGVLSAQQSRPNRQQIAYAYALRVATAGWSPELYRQYFRWFNTARKYEGGNSLRGFIQNMRKQALAGAPESLRAELDSLSAEMLEVAKELPRPKGPGKVWGMEDLLALTKDGLKGRNFENGHTMFQAALCSSCHRVGTEGGGVGPDISGAANRYTMRDLLENILEPSKVISDQYESTLFEKVDGSSAVGRVMEREGDKIAIAENPLDAQSLTVLNTSDIKAESKYPISAMPPALLNSLNEDEVLDLLAFLLSGGNRNDPAFQ